MKKSLISFLFILILVVVSSCTKNTDINKTFNRNLLEGLAVSCTFDSNSLGFSKDAEGKVISVSCVFDDVYKSDFTEFIDFKNGKMIEKKILYRCNIIFE